MEADGGVSEDRRRLDPWVRIGLVAGPIAGVLVYAAVPAGALPPPARTLAAILAFTVVYWVSEPIPLAATALAAPLLCVLLGVAEAREVFRPFASPIVFLFIGTFVLAEAMRKHGLDRRLALGVLGISGVARSPTTLLLAIGATTAFLSMWMSNAATTALVVPVVLGLIRTNPPLAAPRVAAPLLLMISFAATAGGLATPIGTPPNLIGVGQLRALTGHEVSFAGWMTRSLPLTAVLIAALVATLRPWHRTPRFDDHGAITAGFRTQARALGRTSRGEWNVTAVFVAALACWLYPGTAAMIGGRDAPGVTWFAAHLPEEMVGLAAGLVLFALPTDWRRGEFTVDWHDAMRIDWGTILLFGGGMALGGLFATTRLDVALGEALRGRLGTPGLGTLTAAGIGLSIAMSEFTSNTATATVTVPLMIALARAAGLDPVTVGIATTLAASFGNMLPVSTAPNAIVYGSGRVPLSLMMAGGLVFDLLGGLGIWIVTQVAAAGGP